MRRSPPFRSQALLASAAVHGVLVGAGLWVGVQFGTRPAQPAVEVAVRPSLLPPAEPPPRVSLPPQEPVPVEPQVEELWLAPDDPPAEPLAAAWRPQALSLRFGFREPPAAPPPVEAEPAPLLALAPAPPPPPAMPAEPVLASMAAGEFVGAAPLASACPEPDYPRSARRRGVEGLVKVRVDVSEDGRALAVVLEQSSGHDSLDQAALDAVVLWRFVPARRGGVPVSDVIIVPVRFTLLAAG